MMTLDETDGILFSADAFGSFATYSSTEAWDDEARRYYCNIVGKYGTSVQSIMKKLTGQPFSIIAPLHGPVLRDNLAHYWTLYDKWSRYEPEEKGVMIVYASMYGNTEAAAEVLAAKLTARGVTNTRLYDVSSTHVSYLISDLFKYSHLVLASVTYNLGIFPPMHNFLMDMKALNLQKRTVAIMGSGSWAPRSGALMREEIEQLKHMEILDDEMTVTSSLQPQNESEIDALADAIAASVLK